MRRAGWILIAIVVLLGAAGYYFSAVNPVTRYLHYGLDFVGGISAEFEAVPTPGAPVTPEAMQRAMQIMTFRVDKLGVSEPVIQQVGTNRIMVQLPGVKNQEEALAFLGKTALLQIKSPDGKQVLLTGGELANAQAAIAQNPQDPYVVNLTFNAQGTQAFAQATKKYYHQVLPIYLDGKLLEAPQVDAVITDGKAELTGGFTSLKQAQQMALLLQSGALPVKLKVLDVRTVSATLGADSVAYSKLAAALALALIGTFMVVWYRLAGLLADISLGIYMFLMVGALIALNATLTLPGVAGMILSAGMAVDANVIIFSRVKEEMAAGKTPRAAVEAGFRHAIRAILDSNATTFLAGAILFALGSGEVKGFAVTLMVGIVISLFTAVFVTREFIRLAADAGWARNRAVFVG
ncbi:MAG: protein translocase subunit SecD [Actinomycetia bacterium]|jgi:preprotein translocase subunit SecD|nr:protein translocase subunit SecD [Actinomycetes bacterium]